MNLIEYYQLTNKPIKLNLGCRTKPLPTYINIDIDPSNKYADLIDNAFELNYIPDNFCDLIEVVHMFEHLSYEEANQALYLWYKKLKIGGTLRLSVPDISKISALLLLTNDIKIVQSSLNGSQRDKWDFHKSSYTKDSLTKKLLANSYKNIKEWIWQETWPHNYCDSYASCYWPDMRKQFILDNGKEVNLGGICLSLNLECIK